MRMWRGLIAASILAVGVTATVNASVDREVTTLAFVVSAKGCPNLHGTVELTELTRTTTDGQGNVHLGVTASAHGTATDPDGADTWHIIDQDVLGDFVGTIGEDFTLVENFRLIGPGTEPNILIRVIAHFVVLPDGSVAVSFERDTNLDQVACTGNLPG
jgi:hypothetical protein